MQEESCWRGYGIDNKPKLVILLSAFAVIAYMITQLFWVFFVSFGLWETWESDIALYDSLTKVAGVTFFVSASTILFYKLSRNRNVGKKEAELKVPKIKIPKINVRKFKVPKFKLPKFKLHRNVGKKEAELKVPKTKAPTVASNIKNIFKKLFRYILKKAEIAGGFLKKAGISVSRFLYRSRKTVLLVTAVFVVTLVFSFMISTWFGSSDYAPSGNYSRTVSSRGGISVQGLEIYGGDIKYDPAYDAVYVDWGELSLGAYKTASFNIKSNSNVNVTLALNVTNWEPPGIDEFIHISWDYNGTSLSPAQEIYVTVTLEVAADGDFIDFLITNEVTAFGFDMTIYASGV